MKSVLVWSTCLLIFVAAVPVVLADGGVTYHNIARDGAGLEFVKTPSPEAATARDVQEQSLEDPLGIAEFAQLPQMSAGYPGVAVWDYDGDGDLDLYVANGPGSPNSLFRNQLTETGSLTFADEALAAGVAATDQDSSGVCYGDLDNDGDHDLVVLGRHDENRLFENLGDGTFQRIHASGLEGGTRWSTSCSLGDVDGDGLLDLFVANSADASDAVWVFLEPFARNEHNQLFRNGGGLTFTDVSAAAGVEDLAGLDPAFAGSPTVTWAVAMVDVDLDGDVDVVHADDQAGILPEAFGGIDRGLLHVLLNDGTGSFTDQVIDEFGAWMGIAVGDLNCDGALDFHATNQGDYGTGLLGLASTRWFLGAGDGTFADPGVGDLVATPFGWGNVIFDYDNDADPDVLFHGGLDAGQAVIADNAGAIQQNEGCTADFAADLDAIPDDPTCVDFTGRVVADCTEHIRRNVRGVAVGDLDRDGFQDVVTTANFISPPAMPLFPVPGFGGPFDGTAFLLLQFSATSEGLVWRGVPLAPGDLAVEINSGNDNGWAAFTLRGSIGLTSRGEVNRDGIGAVVSFTPEGGPTSMSPVTGGSSHLSQNSLERIFGLGSAAGGTVEVLWPGGVRNRLYDVENGERLVLPEIPCSFDGEWSNPGQYVACVSTALNDLASAGVLEPATKNRFLVSAIRAFEEQ